MKPAPHLGALLLGCSLLSGTALAAPSSAKQLCIEAAEEGQQLRQEGKLTTSAQRFRTCAASECPRMLQKDCSHWLEEVEGSIPSVSVKVEDEDGQEVHNAHVTMDGHAWSEAGGGARRVDPGRHRFVWVREAKAAVVESATLREGERDRIVVLRAPRPAKPPPPKPKATTISPLVWVGYGLGLAAAGGGAAFWAVGLEQRSTLRDVCASSSTCLESDVGASRNNLVLGDVMMGVGIVALAGATYLLVRDLTRAPASLDLDGSATGGGGGGTVDLGLGFGPGSRAETAGSGRRSPRVR